MRRFIQYGGQNPPLRSPAADFGRDDSGKPSAWLCYNRYGSNERRRGGDNQQRNDNENPGEVGVCFLEWVWFVERITAWAKAHPTFWE